VNAIGVEAGCLNASAKTELAAFVDDDLGGALSKSSNGTGWVYAERRGNRSPICHEEILVAKHFSFVIDDAIGRGGSNAAPA
jgi:hypothetical protein